MVGNCIIAVVFSPVLAEFLTFFCYYFRGPIRSDKDVPIGSIKIPPKVFRVLVFCAIFVIFYPVMKYLIHSNFRVGGDIGYIVCYMCFITLIEPVIIHLNGDKSAAQPKNDPENLMFSMKGNLILMFCLIMLSILSA